MIMKRIFASLTILSVFFFFTPLHANAATIAFDAYASGGVIATPTLTKTYSLTTSGSNRYLVVTVMNNGGGDIVTGITYAGTAMTRAIAKPWPVNDANYTYLYYLFAPASGANDIVVTVSANPTQFSTNAASYTGAAQSGTPDTGFLSENASGDRYVSVTVSTANSWLVLGAHVSADAGPTDVVLNGVKRHTGVVDTNPNFFDSNAAVGSGAQTIGLNWSATDRHIMVALAFAPAADTGGSFQLWLLSLW